MVAGARRGGPGAARRDLVTVTVDLCRALRERGVAVTTAETLDAVSALEHVDLGDRAELRRALGILLASRREDVRLVHALFDALWTPRGPRPGRERDEPAIPAPSPGASPREAGAPASLWTRARTGSEEYAGPSLRVRAPSARPGLRRRDLAALAEDEVEEALRVARRLARRLERRRSRRWRPSGRAAAIDPRRTLRRSLRTGGEPTVLARRERKARRTKLTVACDISGSMDPYGRFLLHFLYAMQNAFARVESFVFATRLRRVTPELRGRGWRSALERLGRGVDDWSGGTRIGDCLAELVREWPEVIDRHTMVIVLSDGWDTGDPAVLAEALARIRARARRVIWLNPLLGSPGYEPLARGMRAALPHVDVFAPAHDLESLRALARHLVP